MKLNAKVRSHEIKQHNQGDVMVVGFDVYADDECSFAPNTALKVNMPLTKARREYQIGSCHYLRLNESQTKFDFEREDEPEKETPGQGKLGLARKPRANESATSAAGN